MEKILMLRQKMKKIFSDYDIYIVPLLKGLVMLTVILAMNRLLGYTDAFRRWNVTALICLVCSMMPWSFMTFTSAIIFLIQVFALSWEAAALAACFMFLAMIIQFMFLPRWSMAIVLIPIAYYLRIPYVIPLITGLVGGMYTFLPVGCGTFAWFFILTIQKNAVYLADTSISNADAVERLLQLLNGLFDNSFMKLSILAMCFMTVAVNLVRRISEDHAHYVAVAVGMIVNIVVFLVGGFIMEVDISYTALFVGGILSLVIALLAAFWIIAVDYSRTEYLQFEDDEYVYYVKAVPKINMIAPQRKVSEINSRVDAEDADVREALELLEALDQDEKKKKG